jgi:hypothetical protein
LQAAAASRIVGKRGVIQAAENGDVALVCDHIVVDPACVRLKDFDDAGYDKDVAGYDDANMRIVYETNALFRLVCKALTRFLRNFSLHLSSREGHLEVCKYLISAQADVNAKNCYGYHFLDMRMFSGKKCVVPACFLSSNLFS